MDYLLIALATAAVWAHTISFQFVWDDRQFIVENQSIRSLANLPAMLTRRDAQSSMPEHFALYRPVRTVAYALLNGGSAGPHPASYHLANVVGHGITAMLLCSVSFALLRRFGGASAEAARAAALFIGLAFAVHPVVSEVVCWAKSFDDILAALFCLGSLSQLLKWKTGDHRRLGLAILLFGLGVYSKESAVPFALVPFVYSWVLLRQPVGRSVRLSFGFLLVAAIFVVHRHVVLGQTSQVAPISGTYLQTLIDTIPCAVTYLRLGLGFPPFNIDYAFLDHGHSLLSLQVLLGAAVLIATLIGAAIAARSQRWSLCGFGLLWAGLFFLPVANLIPMMQFMAERFLYLPLIGFLLAGGFLFLQIRNRRIALAAAVVVVSLWAFVGWDRSWIWRNNLALFVQTALTGPQNRVMENNALAEILNLPAVKKVTRPASNVAPSPDEITASIQILSTARKAFPDNPALANALGASWVSAHDLGKAIDCFYSATGVSPRNVSYGRNLGLALLQANRLPEAKAALTKLLTLHPEDIPLLRMLSGVLLSQKETDQARPYILRLKQLDPTSPDYDRWLREMPEGPSR